MNSMAATLSPTEATVRKIAQQDFAGKTPDALITEVTNLVEVSDHPNNGHFVYHLLQAGHAALERALKGTAEEAEALELAKQAAREAAMHPWQGRIVRGLRDL